MRLGVSSLELVIFSPPGDELAVVLSGYTERKKHRLADAEHESCTVVFVIAQHFDFHLLVASCMAEIVGTARDPPQNTPHRSRMLENEDQAEVVEKPV